MRQIQEVLRLKHQNQLSIREIAGSCQLPVSTVWEYLKRAQSAGLGWPLPEALSEEELHQRLFGLSGTEAPPPAHPVPDWAHIHKELRRKNVTLHLLWTEYHQDHPDGYSYSRFCELYRSWSQTVDPPMRFRHVPGEKMLVDWAGQTVPIYLADGTVLEAAVFVAVLAFSNKTFVHAFVNQQLPLWIEAHCLAFSYFGGVSRVLVPDYVPRHIIWNDRRRDAAKVAEGIFQATDEALASLAPDRFTVAFARMREHRPKQMRPTALALLHHPGTQPEIDLQLLAGRAFHPSKGQLRPLRQPPRKALHRIVADCAASTPAADVPGYSQTDSPNPPARRCAGPSEKRSHSASTAPGTSSATACSAPPIAARRNTPTPPAPPLHPDTTSGRIEIARRSPLQKSQTLTMNTEVW